MARFSLQPNMQTFDTLQGGKSRFAPPLLSGVVFRSGGRGKGGGGTQQMFIQVQPLRYTLVNTIFYENGTPFVYLLMTSGTPFKYLV